MEKRKIANVMSGRTGWIVLAAAVGIVGVASGQGSRPNATLNELVGEVQGLRAEVNSMGAASIHAQVLVGRLQMEDQRIAGVARQLDAVQSEMAGSAQGHADAAARIKVLEDSLASVPADVKEQVERDITMLRAAAQQDQARQQDLKQRELSLSKDLEDEQSRWVEINNQLEAFEQSLASR